jgi:hypothetical protein
MYFRRGIRSGIVVVRSVARRSGSSVISGAVTISSMQCNSQDHFSWDRKQLAIVCAVGNAPIPRWSLFVHIKYEPEGSKSKTDLFYRNDDISSWIEGIQILWIVQWRRLAGVWHVQPGTPRKTAALTVYTAVERGISLGPGSGPGQQRKRRQAGEGRKLLGRSYQSCLAASDSQILLSHPRCQSCF